MGFDMVIHQSCNEHPERHEKEIQNELRNEAERPDNQVWYLDFSKGNGPAGWLGAVIVVAPGPTTAIDTVNKLGINPGGEVAGHMLSAFGATKAAKLNGFNRLLTLSDCKEIFGEMYGSDGSVV